MNDDSRLNQPKGSEPRTADEIALDLVEQDAAQRQRQRSLSLAELYRKAKERGLVLPHMQYR